MSIHFSIIYFSLYICFVPKVWRRFKCIVEFQVLVLKIFAVLSFFLFHAKNRIVLKALFLYVNIYRFHFAIELNCALGVKFSDVDSFVLNFFSFLCTIHRYFVTPVFHSEILEIVLTLHFPIVIFCCFFD